MTEEERTMMSTIHVYGLIFSMSDSAKDAALNRIEAIAKQQDSGEKATE